MDYDIGIIGGGAGGLTAAAGAAQLGAKTVLIEKEPSLGGDCLHFGCAPSKTLLHTAKVYHLMRNARRFGLPDAPPPPVDFTAVAARIAEVVAAIQKHDSTERFCGLGVQVLFGEPRFTDEHAVDLDGRSISANKWIIATGSSAMVPPIPGLRESPHLTNRDLFSLDKLPGSLIILGGGPIGVEMAQAFSRLGSRVTVVEQNCQILGPEDPDMARIVQEVLAEEGVEFRLECTAKEVRDLGGARCLVLEAKDGRVEELEAEHILAALGRKANVEGLGLEALDIGVTPRGIAVDERCRTRRKHIFAVGDCNGGLQFTHIAGYEAGVALTNAVLHIPRKTDFTWAPWCTYTDPELGSVGLNEKRARAAGVEFRVFTQKFADNDRAMAEGRGLGRIKLLLDSREKPLGVQAAGPGAGEIINQWVGLLNGKVKLSTLAGAVHPYPTLAEISKRTAGDVFAPKLYSNAVKKTLKILFNLKGRACQPE